MIPGRIYGGFVLGGIETLTPEFLAILAGNLPSNGDEGVSELIHRLLNDHPEFQADQTLRDFEFKFKGYAAALVGDPDERFAATVECFVTNPDLATLRSRLRAIFDGIVALLTQYRLQRIWEAPLDEVRLRAVREAVERALLAETRPGGAFLPITTSRTTQAMEAREQAFGRVDRGSFTRPEMSGITFDDLPPIFVEWARSFFRHIMWSELFQRSKAIEKFDVQLGVAALLSCVQDHAKDSSLGDELILLLPYEPLGEAIYMTASGFPRVGHENYGLRRESSADSGVGCMYAGTIDNIHVYSWQFAKLGVLCSRTLLKAARFGLIHDLNAIVDFQIYDSGDPTESMIRMWLATEFEWESRPVIEFQFSGSAE